MIHIIKTFEKLHATIIYTCMKYMDKSLPVFDVIIKFTFVQKYTDELSMIEIFCTISLQNVRVSSGVSEYGDGSSLCITTDENRLGHC